MLFVWIHVLIADLCCHSERRLVDVDGVVGV